MILETPRLILDTWRSDGWIDLRPIATDVEVMRYITGGVPWTDDQIKNFVDRQIRSYSERGFCRWRLIEKASGDFVGFCGVGVWRDGFAPEIGWWLARSSWGRGFATEAARVSLHDAFERVHLDRIISIARPGNTASIGIMRKLGLQFDAEFEHEGVSLVRYAIDRADYTP
jgi:RimJ/RimL family protein N-acetyltransferase